MSRIGKKPIEIPKGVDVKVDGQTVTVKGPKGELTQSFDKDLKIELNDGVLTVE
ncbi:MAG: 50S ribosomal protein L6, partial [Peptoniphilus harei]|nr:50S ribosomal protein L6 [Peptoniphilus harei]